MIHDASLLQTGDIPSVSIIVLCYNKVEHTRACLEQLHTVTPPDLYELIVVDNASSDGTKEYLQSLQERGIYSRLRIIINDENLGFVGGNNLAAKQSKSKYLVFLNNDTKPQTGWLEALMRLPEEDASVASVGAKLVYPDGRLQEAGGIIYNDASGCNYGKFQNPSHPLYSYVREVDYCSGACLLVRTELFRMLGGFDERYAPAYYEDTDICFALRDAGYKVMYQPDSIVVHFEGATAGTDITSGAKRYQEINRSKFIEKWSTALAKQWPPPANRIELTRAAERIRGRRVLVAHEMPQMYDRASGALRIHNLIRLLIAHGNHVTYACYNSTQFEGLDLEPYVKKLQSMGVFVYPLDGFDSPNNSFYQILAIMEYDAAFLPFYYCAERFIPMIREMSPRTRIVIDSVDIHFLREARRQLLDGGLTAWSGYTSLKNSEIDVYRTADAVLTVTERDKEQLEKYLPFPPVISVSDPHNAVAITPGFKERRDILFLAGFKHTPNVDAAIHFYKEIWPLVIKQLPDIKWIIVGDSPPSEIQALAGDAIVVTGYVPQLEPYLQKARVAIAPIRFGAGMKGKIACSLAQGLPAVSTTIGSEGMGLVNGVSILVADTSDEFAHCIVRLYTDESLWTALATKGKMVLNGTLGDSVIYPQFAKALGIDGHNVADKIFDPSDPVDVAGNISRAYKLLVSGAPDLAEAHLVNLLFANPTNDLLCMNLAVVKSFAGSHAEAFELLNNIRNKSGDSFLITAYMGTVYANSGQHQLAWDSYIKARRMEPSCVWLANEAAYFAVSQKMYAEALECLIRACELQPLNIEVRIKCAEICLILKKVDIALSTLRDALSAARTSKNIEFELQIEKMIADLEHADVPKPARLPNVKFGLIIATKQSASSDYNSLPAAGLGYIAGMIKQQMPEIDVILDQDLDDLVNKKPDIIGISSVTENYHIAIDWALKIKQRINIPVIIGGIHITLLPMSLKPCFDLAIMGEGEFTIVEVLQSFVKNNRTLNFEELRQIRGVFFIKDGVPVMTEPREIIKDLDTMPTIPYDALPFYNEAAGAGCIVASRGCPYKCSFCASEKMFQKYRSFSVERIMQDVRYFIKQGKKHIVFYDDLLIADKHKLEELVLSIEREKINTICSFSCQVRANLITPEICTLLNRMGVKDAGIGIESFSDKILSYYNKTSVTAEINQKAIDLLHEYNIKLNPSIILGAPIETKEDMLITFRAIFKNIRDGKINAPMWGLLRPYPGTQVWEEAERRGIVGIDMDFGKFRDWATFELYLCENVSKNEFFELSREWTTRISLLYIKKGMFPTESNFAISDMSTLRNNVEWLSKLIAMPQRTPELGDDLVNQIDLDNSTMYLNGWYNQEDNYRWMSKESSSTLNSSDMGLILLSGYIPIEILDRVYNGTVELSFFVNGKKSKSYEITSQHCLDGSFKIEIPVEKKSTVNLSIKSNKTFIPNEHGLSDDNRCLSILVVKLEAV